MHDILIIRKTKIFQKTFTLKESKFKFFGNPSMEREKMKV